MAVNNRFDEDSQDIVVDVHVVDTIVQEQENCEVGCESDFEFGCGSLDGGC